MPRRVCYPHVGTAETGTTAIQQALTVARERLRAGGIDYPDLANNLPLAGRGVPTAGNGRR